MQLLGLGSDKLISLVMLNKNKRSHLIGWRGKLCHHACGSAGDKNTNILLIGCSLLQCSNAPMLQCSNAPYKMYKLLVILNSIIAPMLQCSNAPLEHEKMYKRLYTNPAKSSRSLQDTAKISKIIASTFRSECGFKLLCHKVQRSFPGKV